MFEGLDPKGFTTADLPANPLHAVEAWILAAAEAGQRDPHAMTLCTVGADGTPSSRVLICKDIDEQRIYFASRSDSRKGVEIAGQPRVAAQFYWPTVGRQLRLVGTAEAQEQAASERDFAERTRSSQLAALLHGSAAPSGREEILAEYRRLGEAYPHEVPYPPSWTLYGITVTEAEFWEASPDRIHTRVRYRREGGNWQQEYAWP